MKAMIMGMTAKRAVGAVVLPLALVAVGIAAAAALGLGGAWQPEVEASGPLAALVAYAHPVGAAADGRSQIEIIEHPRSGPRPLGSVDVFTMIRLSPKGSHLAGLAGRGHPADIPSVHLIEVASAQETIVPLPRQGPATALVWSPDGSLLAAVGPTSSLLAADGRILGQAQAVRVTDGASESVMSGGYSWSPDEQRFVTLINGDLIVLASDGAAGVSSLSALLPGVNPQSVFLQGWASGAALALQAGAQTMIVDLTAGGPPLVRPTTATDVIAPPLAALGPSKEVADAAAAAAPRNGMVRQQRTADGAAWLFEFRPLANGPAATLVVQAAGALGASVRVAGLDAATTRGGQLVDAFVPRT